MLNIYYLSDLCEIKFSAKASKTDLTISNKTIIFNSDTNLFFLDEEIAKILIEVSPTTFVLPEIKERKDEDETKIFKGENFTIYCNKRTNKCEIHLLNSVKLFGKLKRLKLLIYGVESYTELNVDKVKNLGKMLVHENQYIDRLEYGEYFEWCKNNSRNYSNLNSLNDFKTSKINE